MLTTIQGLADKTDFLFALPVEGGEPIEISFGRDDQVPKIRQLLAPHGWYAFMATSAVNVQLIYAKQALEVVFDKGGRPHHKRLILVQSGFVGERSKSGPFTQFRVDRGEIPTCVKIGTVIGIGGDMKAKVAEMIAWIAETGLGEEFAWHVFHEVGLNAKAVVRRCHDLIATYCGNEQAELAETMDGAWAAGDPLTDDGLPKACQYIKDVACWNVQFDDTVRLYFRIFRQLSQPGVKWNWLQQPATAATKRAAA